MASTRESFRLDGLIEKCRLLLTKNTINNNADLKNKVDNLILEIDKSIKIINRAEIEIKIANEDQYFKWTRNEEQKSRFTTLKENEIRQILEDLNNRYNQVMNIFSKLRLFWSYKSSLRKNYIRLTGDFNIKIDSSIQWLVSKFCNCSNFLKIVS